MPYLLNRLGAQPSSELERVAHVGNIVMVATLACSALGALAIGNYYGTLTLALITSGCLLLLGVCAFLFGHKTSLSRCILVSCNVALVALHIQLGRGTIEFHFGVFVLLGLLLVYRDWRPIVFGAALFAIHHLAFDRLQAMGVGVYCTPAADLFKTSMHAVYVIAQTGIEIYLAIGLRKSTVEGCELAAIVRSVDRNQSICLDDSQLRATSPTAIMLRAVIGKMGAAMTDVRIAAGAIELASSEIAGGNLNLSQRTEEQASSLQQTASAMVQITSTVENTAVTAQHADALASSASQAATAGGQTVQQVVSTMADIQQSSARVAEIVGVVEAIAFQTNILALNAAVEAARAGEQGRGFSVVASEVRLLAQRSATAAKEIKSLVATSLESVNSGHAQVGAAGDNIVQIVDQARRVSQLIAEISCAVQEQKGGITMIGDAVSQLDTVTQQNAALVEESASAADSLAQQAIQLNAVVNRFTLSG